MGGNLCSSNFVLPLVGDGVKGDPGRIKNNNNNRKIKNNETELEVTSGLNLT